MTTRLFVTPQAAAPARAKELIKANAESLATADAVEAPYAGVLDRLAELRLRIQQGRYSVNFHELSAKIIERHLREKRTGRL